MSPCVGGASRAEAQPPLDAPEDALPGALRVPFAVDRDEVVSLAGRAAYGVTEDVGGGGAPHHRIAGGLALGLRPLPWLLASVALDGRYDRHRPEGGPVDDGWIGDPRVTLRLVGRPAAAWGLGVEATVWVPGEDAPSLHFEATTVDAEAFATWRPSPGAVVSLRGGYRFDRSARSISGVDQLGPGDRVAIGLSDFDAVLVGAAGSVRLGPVELLGEWTWDVLVGGPPLAVSPMRAAAAARWDVFGHGGLALTGAVETLLSGRPSPASLIEPLVPIEPRVQVTLALAVRPGAFAERPAPAPSDVPPPEAEARAEPPVAPPPEVEPPEPPAPAPPVGWLRGVVRGFDGRGLAATVSVPALEQATTTDAEGTFELELPPGPHVVRVEAPGFQAQERRLEVEDGGVTILNADLRRAARRGTRGSR